MIELNKVGVRRLMVYIEQSFQKLHKEQNDINIIIDKFQQIMQDLQERKAISHYMIRWCKQLCEIKFRKVDDVIIEMILEA